MTSTIISADSNNCKLENLVEKDKILVKKAFKQSKFYKYYLTLVNKEDDLKILGADLLKTKRKGANVIEFSYRIHFNLIIKDKIFKRWFDTTHEAKIICQSDGLFNKLFIFAGGSFTGIVIILIILL